jgi:hypothetical protein
MANYTIKLVPKLRELSICISTVEKQISSTKLDDHPISDIHRCKSVYSEQKQLPNEKSEYNVDFLQQETFSRTSCRKISYSVNYSQHVTTLSNHLFEISAIQKNKLKKINIPQGTQLVEKGKDDVGNTIFMFHIYENGKLVSYTTTEIPKHMLYLLEIYL